MGGKFLLKLNTGERPIAYKYREGKMKRTLKRESLTFVLASVLADTAGRSEESSVVIAAAVGCFA